MITVNRKSVNRKDLAYVLIMQETHSKHSAYPCLYIEIVAYYPRDRDKQRPYNPRHGGRYVRISKEPT